MDELTPDQLDELRRDLSALSSEVEGFLVAGKEETRTVDLGLPIGRLSRMEAIQQQSIAKASRRNLEVRQQQIRAALRAIDEDEYGYCRRCEEPIGYRRLKVRPESPFCIDCQQRGEGRAKR